MYCFAVPIKDNHLAASTHSTYTWVSTQFSIKESEFLEETDDSRTSFATYRMSLEHLELGEEEEKYRRPPPYRWRYDKGTHDPNKNISSG